MSGPVLTVLYINSFNPLAMCWVMRPLLRRWGPWVHQVCLQTSGCTVGKWQGQDSNTTAWTQIYPHNPGATLLFAEFWNAENGKQSPFSGPGLSLALPKPFFQGGLWTLLRSSGISPRVFPKGSHLSCFAGGGGLCRADQREDIATQKHGPFLGLFTPCSHFLDPV